MSAVPTVGESRPRITRIVVVLPAPVGPRKPVTFPGWTAKLSPSTAVTGPKRLVSPLTSMTTALTEGRRCSRSGGADCAGACSGWTGSDGAGGGCAGAGGLAAAGGSPGSYGWMGARVSSGIPGFLVRPKARYARPPHGTAAHMTSAHAHLGR